MKSIEEKAKAYDKALEKIHQFIDGYSSREISKEKLEDIFSELKESEYEKTRKEILDYIIKGSESCYDVQQYGKEKFEKWIAWLEKQGEQKPENYNHEMWKNCQANFEGGKNEVINNPEKYGLQKPADIIEQKFEVGDWITNNLCTWKIESIKDGMYYTNYNGIDVGGDIESIDNHYHLWTIQDAKDGEVLITENGWSCIFKKLIGENHFASYCFMDSGRNFYNSGSETHTTDPRICGKIFPTTKEQEDIFFNKMEQFGNIWDPQEKKVIIINPTLKEKEEIDKGFTNMMLNQNNEKLNEFEQKVRNILDLSDAEGHGGTDIEHTKKLAKDLLDSIKRIYRWNDEDEIIFAQILGILSFNRYKNQLTPYTYNKMVNWIKSLKDKVVLQLK